MLSCADLCNRPNLRRCVRLVLQPTFAVAAILSLALTSAYAQETVGAKQPKTQLPLQILSTKAALAAQAPATPKLLKGHVLIPSSNVIQASEIGKMMHTNYRVFVPDQEIPSTAYPPFGGYLYETPESIACLYGIVTPVAGCNPNSAVNVPNGGSQSIAIVDAYDNPTLAGDVAYFSDQMGIPFKPSQFQIVYASGTQPAVDYTGGWEVEAALDVEYAHAMAPNATIYLVEANSNFNSDLFPAVSVATNLVQCGQTTTCPSGSTGKGEVSMSWGGDEFATESLYDSSYFSGANVVYLASAGDTAGPEYPAASPNVISVGGTTVARSSTTGGLIAETIWQDTGGGPSTIETKGSYQSSLGSPKRVTPDVAADADPETGLWVYSSFPQDGYFNVSNWLIVGGTSASVQVWAGILNAASTANGSFAASSTAELTMLYNDAAGSSYTSDFRDITIGNCYYYRAAFGQTKYDWCTGLGVPNTYAGK